MQLATTLARAYARAFQRIRSPWRVARISLAMLTSMLATASAAHAHGGMAGPSEIGPPLLTSGALGFACYWLVMLWPSTKKRIETPDGSGTKRGSSARVNGQSNTRKSSPIKQTPHLKKVADKMRLLVGIFAFAIAAIVSSSIAYAHGEAGDEPFLKDLTTAF